MTGEVRGMGMVGADGRPRVSDFGLAHVVGQDTEQSGLVGTCAYMSPEQAAGRGNLDERSDVCGLGAVPGSDRRNHGGQGGCDECEA